MNKNDDTLVKNVRQVLDQSLDELDAATRSGLTQARYRALDRRQQRTHRLLLWGSVPAAGLTLLVLFMFWSTTPSPELKSPGIAELHIITAAEPLDFYQEELEFYEWLSEVMENEKEFSERLSPRLPPVAAEPDMRSGRDPRRVAESGTARIPGFI